MSTPTLTRHKKRLHVSTFSRRRFSSHTPTIPKFFCYIDETGTPGLPDFAFGVLVVPATSVLGQKVKDLRTISAFTSPFHASAMVGPEFEHYVALSHLLAEDSSWSFTLHAPKQSTSGHEGYLTALTDALLAANVSGPVAVVADRWPFPSTTNPSAVLRRATRGKMNVLSASWVPSASHNLVQVTDVLTYLASDPALRGKKRGAKGVKARLVAVLRPILHPRI